MPVVLDRSCWWGWMEEGCAELADLRAVSRRLLSDELVWWRVTGRVADRDARGPDLIEPVAE